MKNATGFYPRPDIDTTGTQVVSHAGTILLTETITKTGLDHALSTALSRWRPRLAFHDPARVAVSSALEQGKFGRPDLGWRSGCGSSRAV